MTGPPRRESSAHNGQSALATGTCRTALDERDTARYVRRHDFDE
jgi:hypothetical protein